MENLPPTAEAENEQVVKELAKKMAGNEGVVLDPGLEEEVENEKIVNLAEDMASAADPFKKEEGVTTDLSEETPIRSKEWEKLVEERSK